MPARRPARTEYTLVVLNGREAGQRVPLSGSEARIGRRAVSDVCLSWDSCVSRDHARLRRERESWLLEDLGSTNGTYLGDNRLDGTVVLTAGDRVRIGRTWLELRLEGQTGAEDDLGAEGDPAAQPQEDDTAAESLWRRALSLLSSAAGGLALSEETEPIAGEAAPKPVEQPTGTPSTSAGLLKPLPAVPRSETLRPAEDDMQTRAEFPAAKPSGSTDLEARAAPPTLGGWVACTISPLRMEIRALCPGGDGQRGVDELKCTLRDFRAPEDVAVRITETLGRSDARISVSAAAPGCQAAVLTCAGEVVERLVEAWGCQRVVLAEAGSEGPDGQ